MKKSITALMINLGFISCLCSQSMSWDWVFATGGSFYQLGEAMDVDSAGNVYVAGTYQNWLTINDSLVSQDLLSYGGRDIYLCKYDASGKLCWVTGAGGIGDESVGGIDTDRDGNVYITGGFRYTAFFGSGSNSAIVIAPLDEDGFVAKYSPSGDLIYVFTLRGELDLQGYDMCTFDDGGFCITGAFTQTAYFGDGIAILSRGEMDIFMAVYNESGSLMCVTRAGGVSVDEPLAITTDKEDNILLTGAFSDNALFGEDSNPVTLASEGELDMFIVKYNREGNLLWAKSAGSSDWDTGKSVTCDESGNVYVGGFFQDTLIFENGPGTISLESFGSVDGFLVKYSSNGEIIWAHHDGGTGYDEVNGITADGYGRIYCTGAFSNVATFGHDGSSKTFQSNGTRDIFISKYLADGTFIWATAHGSLQYDAGMKTGTSANGHLYVTGSLGGTASFGDILVETGGQSDILLGRLLNPAASTGDMAVQEPDIRCLPNPSRGDFTLIAADRSLEIQDIEIFDQAGKIINARIDRMNSAAIHVRVEPSGRSGVLFLRIYTDRGGLFKRILIL